LIAEGIISRAERQGWELLDLSSWRWSIPPASKVDGLIYSHDASKSPALDRLRRCITHHVEISPASNRNHPCVAIDWAAVGLQAAEYYLNRGFRNFALASYRTDEWTLSLRTFKERIEQAGGQCQAIQGLNIVGVELDEVRAAVRQQLHDLTCPLGIFCANDRLAVRLCRWCREEDIAVPEQAAILGYGNDLVACCSNSTPLSSIDPNHTQCGIEAALLLQRMMNGEKTARDSTILVPPRGIVTRRSTDIMAIPDARVAGALRYIWDHYTKDICPNDVADFCGIPRRSLDRRFKEAIGRTVMREVLRQRLAKASEMLTFGTIPVIDIAAMVGFTTPQYFNFQFKKHFGCTPQRYRDREKNKR
jgi:LacI family transcriptional regulator